jgi:MFS family permease
VIFKQKPHKSMSTKVSHSLSHSVKDGKWWSVMVAFGESFIGAFGQLLGASALMQGLLTTIPLFISSLATLCAQHLTAYLKSRKLTVLVFAIIQAFSWLGIVFLALWFKSVFLLLVLATVYFVAGAIANPVWSSWMGDLVPAEKRGAYFGYRSEKMALWLLVSTVLASFALWYFADYGDLYVYIGFFTIAFLARLISSLYLWLMYEPQVELKKFPWLSPSQYIEKASNNLLKFSFSHSFLLFGVYVASPFIIILYFKVLEFTLFQYSIILLFATLANVITVKLWGKKSDEYGSSAVLKVSSLMIIILPIFWYLSYQIWPEHGFLLCLIAETIGGAGWAAYNLATSNFLYDNAQQEYRIVLFSYHHVIRGIAILIGTLFGTLLITISGGALLLAIVASCFLRAIAAMSHLFLKEVTYKKQSPPLYMLAGSVAVQSVAVTTMYGLNRTVDFVREGLESFNKELDYWKNKFEKK